MTKYCRFYPHLYIGDNIRHPIKVKWKLTHGAGQVGVYVIAASPESDELLAILHCANLKQDYFKEHPLYVYAIAWGEAEAQRLLVQISDEACARGMDGRLKAYLDARVAPTERDR